MLISSTGSDITFWLSFLLPSAMAREIGPTLPKYIVTIIMILPSMFRLDVRLRVSPTVALALTVSKIASMAGMSFVAIKIRVEREHIVINAVVTATAFFTDASEIPRPKRVALLLLRMVENAEHTKTATVTVLIPPAVPTGEPPISINIIETNVDAFVKFSWAMPANPAVLVVMDWNNDA